MADEKKEEKTLEEAFSELDVLAGRLEDRETSLEDSFRLYKQGMELLKYCNDKLDTVEKKMLQMNEDAVLSSGRGRFCEDYGAGNELQYSGRRKAPSPYADPGNLKAVWRRREAGISFYGSNGDDSYPFTGP